MATPAEIREALLAQKNRGANRNTERKPRSGDNALYTFWNAPVGGDPVVLRFLPDGDPDNTFFWVKREIIKLPFSGVVGGDYPTNKPVEVTVPCADMFPGLRCPIIAATRSWWDDENKKELARRYYKKKSWVFQGFVVNSPIIEEDVPENPIRRFIMGPQIFKVIEDFLLDPQMEDKADDYISGYDFYVKSSKQGQFTNYGTSNWSRKPRSLSQTELDAIETHGLFDLKASLGAAPDAEHLAVIEALFQSSIAGEPFDYTAFGSFYRPYGSRDDGDVAARVTEAATPLATPTTAQQTPQASAGATNTVAMPKSNATDLLARIRARTGSSN